MPGGGSNHRHEDFQSSDLLNTKLRILSKLFITSKFHENRVRAIVEHIEKIHNTKTPYEFLNSKDNLINIDRNIHEKNATMDIKKLFSNIDNFNELISYLLEGHSCYNFKFSGRRLDKGKEQLY